MSEIIVKSVEDLDSAMDRNHAIRDMLIDAQLKDKDGNLHIPTDKESVYMVAALLKDSDATLARRKRMNVDLKIADTENQAALIFSKLSERLNGQRRHDTPPEHTAALYEPDADALPSITITDQMLVPLGTEVDLEEISAKGRAHYKGIESTRDAE